MPIFQPLILFVSMSGSILGTLLTKPENDEMLEKFYKSVHSWGFWKPVLEKVQKKNPDFRANNQCAGICPMSRSGSSGSFPSWRCR